MNRSCTSLLAMMSMLALAGGAQAASDSFVGGGVLQQGIDALQQQLARQEKQSNLSKLTIVDRDAVPGIGFTPRLAGGPIEVANGVSVDRGSLLKARVAAVKNDRRGQALRFAQSHDLGVVALDLSAIAGFAERDEKNLESASTLGFGGGLRFDSLGGLRLDASYSRRDELLGLARDRVTAGLGYNFGSLDTRVSVSNVSQYDIDGAAADEQQVWALGGQMQLSSSFVVGGDLAYSTSLNGSADTSGVVNFRFNF